VQAELKQLREENAAMLGELATARLAVASCGIDVTDHPSLAAAIRHLDRSAQDFAVAADQRTNAKERECERLRQQVRRFAAMVGEDAVTACHAKPDLFPGIIRMSCTAVPLRPEDVAAKSREVG
jgi:hypothetical protein